VVSRFWLYETQRLRFSTAAGFAVVPVTMPFTCSENTNFAKRSLLGSSRDDSSAASCERFCAGTNYLVAGGAGAVAGYYYL